PVAPCQRRAEEQSRIRVVAANTDAEDRARRQHAETGFCELRPLLYTAIDPFDGAGTNGDAGDGYAEQYGQNTRARPATPSAGGRPDENKARGCDETLKGRLRRRQPEAKRHRTARAKPEPTDGGAVLARTHSEAQAQDQREVRSGGVDVRNVRRK